MRRFLVLAALPLWVAACDVDNRPGTWQFTGANDANLRAMIANPDDLVTGVSDRRADGQVVAAAVARYRAGKVKDLPEASISKIAPISNTSGGSSSAASTQ
jgi:type IV pilus biogenesis protein CpaD/CtpE